MEVRIDRVRQQYQVHDVARQPFGAFAVLLEHCLMHARPQNIFVVNADLCTPGRLAQLSTQLAKTLQHEDVPFTILGDQCETALRDRFDLIV